MKDIALVPKKYILISLIKRVSQLYGGDDGEWLRQYTNEVLSEWSQDMDRAIECFEDLKQQAEVVNEV